MCGHKFYKIPQLKLFVVFISAVFFLYLVYFKRFSNKIVHHNRKGMIFFSAKMKNKCLNRETQFIQHRLFKYLSWKGTVNNLSHRVS